MQRITPMRLKKIVGRVFFKAMALWMVAFYILAAGRGAIPGICATNEELRQVIRLHEQTPVIHALKSCCMAFGKTEGKAPPAHVACPFCKLLSVSFDPPQRVVLNTPADRAAVAGQLPPATPHAQDACGVPDGRAPPACA